MYPPSIPHPLYTSLPSRSMEWNIQDCSPRIELTNSNLITFSHGDRPEAACIRTIFPIVPFHAVFYWEMTISSSGSSASPIAVGLSVKDAPLNRFPGWEPGSFGYHGDDGHIFGAAGLGTLYGPTFGSPGDTVGTLIVFSAPSKDLHPVASVRFTKNGQLLSVAFKIDWESPYYPTLGLRVPGDSILTNFGISKPFRFDIDEFIQHIQLMSLGRLSSFIPEFLAEHLIHSDCSSTLSSFASSFKGEDLIAFSVPLKKHVQQRQSLASLVKTGNITQALHLLDNIPNFLSSHPQFLFELKCQQFIEAVRPFVNSLSYDEIIEDFKEMDILLSLAQSIADICSQHKLVAPKKQLIFSLFLYMGHKPFPSSLSMLFQEEARIKLAEDLIHILILFFDENPYSSIEIVLRHTAALLEEMHCRSDLFPSSLLVHISEFS